MAILKLNDGKLEYVERTTFDKHGILERQHLQAMLRDQVEVISPDTLVVAEEFGDWEGSNRRIDLLGVNNSGHLVVIELKRTEDGGHMELQALRYASMISTLTYSRLVQIYQKYIDSRSLEIDAEEGLLSFLGWDEPDEDEFAQEVKIVLASAEFSKELTTTVIWLNDFGLDIRCVRMHPYLDGPNLLLDVQTVIPVPETADYQVRVREKKQQERAARSQNRDLTKFDLQTSDSLYGALNKRRLIHKVVSSIIENGHTPIEIQTVADNSSIKKKKLFKIFDGELSEDELHKLIMKDDPGGSHPRTARYFCNTGVYYFHDGNTYILSNQWGQGTLEFIRDLKKSFENIKLEVSESKS